MVGRILMFIWAFGALFVASTVIGATLAGSWAPSSEVVALSQLGPWPEPQGDGVRRLGAS